MVCKFVEIFGFGNCMKRVGFKLSLCSLNPTLSYRSYSYLGGIRIIYESSQWPELSPISFVVINYWITPDCFYIFIFHIFIFFIFFFYRTPFNNFYLHRLSVLWQNGLLRLSELIECKNIWMLEKIGCNSNLIL